MANDRYKIGGYAGEHDEDGASILDTVTGIRILHTAGLCYFAGDWHAYYANVQNILSALNAVKM